MSLLSNIYQKSVADNERNIQTWDKYVNQLKSLDFTAYVDTLKVPILVPIGSRIFFRGELKHTNEVTVNLGADYFVKCSLKQAEVLRQHRLKDAGSKLEAFRQEKEFLEDQLSFTKQNVFEKDGQEIVEVFTEEEDKAWRQKHRENVRKYKQGKAKEERLQVEVTDEEVWQRLEELELEEEMENELLDNYNEIGDKRKSNSFLVNEEKMLFDTFRDDKSQLKSDTSINKKNEMELRKEIMNLKSSTEKTVKIRNVMHDTMQEPKSTEMNDHKNTTRLELLQKVIDKQNELEVKLLELKNRDRQPSKTEKDLMSILDEMEIVDELEDDMDRLNDILETEDVDSDDEVVLESNPAKLKKSISFADEVEDTSQTLEVTFKHSDVEPNSDPYDPAKGITKPSDIYEVHLHHSNKNNDKPTSILKKSKYDSEYSEEILPRKQVKMQSTSDNSEIDDIKNTIVVKDVIENPITNESKINMDAKPTSLFKKRRMQYSKSK